MISDASPVEHSGPLPKSADVVVIGGGVIGVCTALFLARKGQQVLLLEKGRIAAEQSSRNWGWIRQQGRDPDELPIMVEAARLWRELAGQTGEDIGLVTGGLAYMARDEKQMAKYAGWLPHAQANGVDTRLLSRVELADLIPDARRNWQGGLYTASDMRAEPWLAVPALARLAALEGATLIERCAARGIERSAGQVSAVVSEAGRIETSQVVVAGGAWSALFLHSIGVNIPQLSVLSTVVAATGGAAAVCEATRLAAPRRRWGNPAGVRSSDCWPFDGEWPFELGSLSRLVARWHKAGQWQR